MKVIFAGYRDWALKVLPAIQRHPRVEEVKHVNDLGSLELLVTGRWGDMVSFPAVVQPTIVMGEPGELFSGKVVSMSDTSQFKCAYDLVLLCGWSWQVSKDLLNRVPVISEHPAYLDEYSLGTPLQGQIEDGIKYTKHRVVKIGYPELGERLYSPNHEVDMNLTGNMDDILDEMASTCKTIYTRFLDDWPNIHWEQWPKAEQYRTPRKPHNSKLSQAELHMGTKYLYDKIRMLESPYPNAFIEDDDGILYFERVSYKSKK